MVLIINKNYLFVKSFITFSFKIIRPIIPVVPGFRNILNYEGVSLYCPSEVR